MRISWRVLHDVRPSWSVSLLSKVWNFPSLQPCFNTHCEISLWKMQASTVFWHVLHRRACQVSLAIAEPCVKKKTRKYRNETFILIISISSYILTARWTPYVTQIIEFVLCLLQRIDWLIQTLDICWNTETNKFVPKLWCILQTPNVDITV